MHMRLVPVPVPVPGTVLVPVLVLVLVLALVHIVEEGTATTDRTVSTVKKTLHYGKYKLNALVL